MNEPVAGWASPERPNTWPFRRILVTGSRSWTDRPRVRAALAWVWHPTTVLVHGACPTGADALVDACWRHWGGHVEPWPADWNRYGRAAGPVRNQAMVEAGADMALAFPLPRSRGTRGALRLLVAAGIPTYIVPPGRR